MESRRIMTYRALASTSRVALMDSLRGRHGLTITELSEAVHLHPNTTREHLTRLIEAGLVSCEPEQRQSRGRPRMLYRAAEGTENIVLPPDFSPRAWSEPQRQPPQDVSDLPRRVCHEHHDVTTGTLTSSAGQLDVVAMLPFAHEAYCVLLLGHVEPTAGQFDDAVGSQTAV